VFRIISISLYKNQQSSIKQAGLMPQSGPVTSKPGSDCLLCKNKYGAIPKFQVATACFLCIPPDLINQNHPPSK
jgi:hypothetical protein